MSCVTSPSILHVVERPGGTSDDFDRAVCQAEFDVEHVETVYGAMARLVRPCGRPIAAVLVCLDGLEANELEFFTLAAQYAPGVPIYVYGRSADGQRRQRAVSLGADSEVTLSRITAILPSLHQNRLAMMPTPSEATNASASSGAPTAVLAAKGPSGSVLRDNTSTVLSHDGSDVPQTESVGGQSTGTATGTVDRESGLLRAPHVPTPWQPSTHRPKRLPPGRSKQTNQPAGAADTVRTTQNKRATGEPLLSQQEVEALLSDSLPTEDTGQANHDPYA